MPWIRATFVGWLLGLLFVITLAFVFDAIGLSGTQSFVGIGMSVGVALMQRAHLPVAAPRWLATSVLGLSLPFVIVDALSLLGFGSAYSLPVCAALGGALAGWWQSGLLRGTVERRRWTMLSAGGWTVGAGTVMATNELMMARYLTGVPALFTFVILAAVGGVLLGAITRRGFVSN